MDDNYKVIAAMVVKEMVSDGFEERTIKAMQSFREFDNGQGLCCALAVLTFLVSTAPERYHAPFADYIRDYILTHVGETLGE